MKIFLSYLVSPFIAALLATFLALWRYRSEKWWELKVSTYMKILESLHEIKQHFNHEYKMFIYSNPKVCDEIAEAQEYKESYTATERKRIKSKLRETKELAMKKIEKCIDIGSFIIRNEAIKCLEKFNNDYLSRFNDEDTDNYFLRMQNIIEDCILQIKNIAHNDSSRVF